MIITRKKNLQEQVQYKRICKSRILAPSDYCLHNQLIFFSVPLPFINSRDV